MWLFFHPYRLLPHPIMALSASTIYRFCKLIFKVDLIYYYRCVITPLTAICMMTGNRNILSHARPHTHTTPTHPHHTHTPTPTHLHPHTYTHTPTPHSVYECTHVHYTHTPIMYDVKYVLCVHELVPHCFPVMAFFWCERVCVHCSISC